MPKRLTHRQLTESLVERMDKGQQVTESLIERVDAGQRMTESLIGRMDKNEATLDKVLVELVDLKEYVHTEVATKKELHTVRDELVTHIDGLYKRTGDLDHESAANRNRSERLETRITRIETHAGLT